MLNNSHQMKELPLVSVVIPCLNRAQFLIATIESILQQSYSNIECIVVDGGSTDESIEILKRYGDRIHWVSEPDNGHADAINKGWKMSQGTILAWLNADDVWVIPDAVNQVVKFFRKNTKVDVVYGDCGTIDKKGNLIGMSYLHEWDLEYAFEYCDHCIPQPAAFIQRRILEKVGWLDVGFISKKDHELWLRIGLAGNIHHIPILLAHARACPGYMKERGDITAAACVRLTKKFIKLPNLPERIRNKRKLAISNAYFRGMDYAWHDGRYWKTILSYGFSAMIFDLNSAVKVIKRIMEYAKAILAEKRVLRWAIYDPLRILGKTLREVKQWMRGPVPPCIPNLLGDRDIEWSWVASQMPSQSGEALDFGPGGSHLALIATQRGFNVTAVDLGSVRWPYVHPRLRFLKGDLLKLPLPKGHFDLVINCSTVEHVGLAGRYGIIENRLDGDLEAMARLKELMKTHGIMLLTIPVGKDAVFKPLTRVYGRKRLSRLFDGYIIEKKMFWIKDQENRWVPCAEETALNLETTAGSWDPLQNMYALGCFVLRKPSQEN